MKETQAVHHGKPKRRSIPARALRFLLRTAMLLVLLAVVLLVSLNVYLASNESKIFDNIGLLNGGGTSFKSAKVRVFRDFPLATISVDSLKLHDARFSEHRTQLLDLRQVKATASLRGIFDREVDFQSLELRDGNVRLFKDESGYSNLSSFLKEKNKAGEQREDTFVKLLTNNVSLHLHNVDVHFSDAQKTTSIHGNLEDLKVIMRKKPQGGLACKVDMAVSMKELTFKQENGAFIKDSKLSGSFDVDLLDGHLRFAPFALQINEEQFQFSGDYDMTKQSQTKLVLENKAAKWEHIAPLLASDIQGKIKPYNIAGPFYAKATISSHFRPGEAVKVHIDFKLEQENKVKVQKFLFEKVRVSGSFVNRYDANDDEVLGLRFDLKNVHALYDNFAIKTDAALISSHPVHGARLATEVNINGKPADISRFFKNDKFFFKRGIFTLNAKVDGSLKDFKQLALESEARLTLRDFSVLYKPSNTAFPFKKLSLYKKSGDADFSIISSVYEKGNDFRIDGIMQNLNVLLFNLDGRANSDVNFVADKLNWTDFLNIFGENGYLDDGKKEKDDNGKKASMKQTIRGIHYQFQPKISVAVDTLAYFDKLILHHFKTGVHFSDENTVVLEKTSFQYGLGTVNLQGSMDIREVGRTPFSLELHAKRLNLATLLPPFDYFGIKLLAEMDHLPTDLDIDIVQKGILDDKTGLIPHTSTGYIAFNLDNGKTLLGRINYEPGSGKVEIVDNKKQLGSSLKTQLSLEGDPFLFNGFLKNERFFLKNGRFTSLFNYNGDITDFRDLMLQSEVDFTLKNSEVYYSEGDVSFPLNEINLQLKNDNADFDAILISDKVEQEIKLNGNIENLSEIVIGKTGKQVKTNVSISSQSIKWSEFLGLFADKDHDTTKVHNLKKTARGIMDAFNPTVCVYLDTFVYSSKLALHSVKTGLTMQDSITLRLDETGFLFNDGTVRLNGSIGLGTADATPFEAHFQADSLDFAAMLYALDYLNIPSFKDIKKLSGQTDMQLDWWGIMVQGGKGVRPAANEGKLNFELRNINIKGFAPLDKLAAKIWMKKRFAEVKFAPISNQLIIRGDEVEIPLMEIQSNVLNMFIEGTYSYGNNTNIWVTVPLYNLKSADRSVIPPKKGYEKARAKFFLEVTSDEQGENKFKFHLSKKKFYKQRGIPAQYRQDLKKNRVLRKAKKRAESDKG